METEIKRSHKKDPSKEGFKLMVNTDLYRIDPDPYCWILRKQEISQPSKRWKDLEGGVERWETVGYFSNIFQIVQKLIDMGCKDIKAEELQGFKQSALSVAKKLEQTLTDLGIERKLKKYHS